MTEKHKKEIAACGCGPGSSKKTRRAVAGALLAALVIAAAVFFIGADKGKFPSVEASDGFVRIPVADLRGENARFFTFRSEGKEINFFVLRSSDGVIRAAFDACDVCYPEKKGYGQDGDYMVCRNCGQRFPSASINEVRGGCNPSPLDRAVEGDYIVISAEALKKGSFYF